MNKNLIIRADATTRIGTGHIMRCIALAQAWQDRGGDVTFLSHCDSKALRQRIIDEGFDFIPIEKPCPDPNDLSFTLDMLSAISHQPSAASPWLALDGYHFTPDYQKAIRDNGYRLLVIDDMAHLDHYYADILLNQNIHASSLHYSCDRDTVKLLGCEYVLLRREFLKYKDWKRKIPEKAKKIMVTLGGTDPDNVTLKVIRALNNLGDQDLEVKVVAGSANPNIDTLKKEFHLSPFTFHLLPGVSNMPELMVWADIAISAGGTTVWELAFMGVPNLVIVTADNQRPIAEQLHRLGAAVSLGWHENISTIEIEQGVTKLLTTRGDRTEMVRRAQEVVDGEGATRVLMQMCRKNITLRPIHEDDCRLLWEWANDPAARTAAFSSDQIPWEEHLGWFKHKLNEPNCFLFIAVDDQDTPVGQVRLDVNGEGEAEIDVSLDKSKRGLGYGSHIIDMAAEEMFRSTAVQTIHAFIKFDNKSSMKAFEKARFEKLGIETVRGIEALHYARVKSNEQQIFKPDILSGWQQALELSSL